MFILVELLARLLDTLAIRDGELSLKHPSEQAVKTSEKKSSSDKNVFFMGANFFDKVLEKQKKKAKFIGLTDKKKVPRFFFFFWNFS